MKSYLTTSTTKSPLPTASRDGHAAAGATAKPSSIPPGTWYQVIEAGKATQWASAESGTITVSKNGDDYTVSWDLTSDAGCKVTGSYTGPIDIIL